MASKKKRAPLPTVAQIEAKAEAQAAKRETRATPAQINRAKDRIYDLTSDVHERLREIMGSAGWDNKAAAGAARDIIALGRKLGEAIAKLDAL